MKYSTSKTKISFVTLLVLYTLVTVCQPAKLPGHFIHRNLCNLISPEPIVYLSNYFGTSDNFFPSSYKERRCAAPAVSSSSSGPVWPTCLNGKYHCVTHYRQMKFLRIPRLANGSLSVTFASATVEKLRVPVACECSDYTTI